MSFNTGGFNQMPFNRAASIPVFFEAAFDTTLDIDTKGFEIINGFIARFDTTLDIEATFERLVSFESNFDTSFDIDNMLIVTHDLEAKFDASLDVGAAFKRIVYFTTNFDTTLDMQADFFTGRKQEAQILTTLRPNDILIIDSCTYMVTLNGENAFEYYGGDWIFLEEGSTDLILSSNSGGKAEVKIDVVPRWL